MLVVSVAVAVGLVGFVLSLRKNHIPESSSDSSAKSAASGASGGKGDRGSSKKGDKGDKTDKAAAPVQDAAAIAAEEAKKKSSSSNRSAGGKKGKELKKEKKKRKRQLAPAPSAEAAADKKPVMADDSGVGPNGWAVHVNDTMLPDGRPISAHCVMAVLEQKHETLKALVDPLTEQQASELTSIDHWCGMTLLDCSMAGGDVETIAYLIDKGADVHGRHYETDQTCLHLAAASGQASAVQLLVQRLGANPLALDRNGVSPFTTACVAGDTAGHLAVLEYLLSLKKLGCPIDINQPDGTAEGRTSLGWANKEGHTAVAEWLARNGAVLEFNPPGC